MKNSTKPLITALAALLASCGNNVAAEQENAAPFAQATLDAVPTNSDEAAADLSNHVTAEPVVPVPTSSVPSYSSIAYCRKIGETAGGSSMIERSCRDMEAEALAAIRSRSIPARIHSYCDKIGQTAGGSYSIYKSCVDMESEAASGL